MRPDEIKEKMKKLITIAITALLATATVQAKDVADIAIGSSDHTTLVAAVKAADLVGTLKSDGPFTVFAPTNSAFADLPEGTVETLLESKNKDKLAGILTYHVVAGKLDAEAVTAAVKKGNGKATVETVAGGELVVSMMDGKVTITDENGNSAHVVAADLMGSNGVVHVVDAVLLPKA